MSSTVSPRATRRSTSRSRSEIGRGVVAVGPDLEGQPRVQVPAGGDVGQLLAVLGLHVVVGAAAQQLVERHVQVLARRAIRVDVAAVVVDDRHGDAAGRERRHAAHGSRPCPELYAARSGTASSATSSWTGRRARCRAAARSPRTAGARRRCPPSIVAVKRRTPRARAASASAQAERAAQALALQRVADDDRGLGGVRVLAQPHEARRRRRDGPGRRPAPRRARRGRGRRSRSGSAARPT